MDRLVLSATTIANCYYQTDSDASTRCTHCNNFRANLRVQRSRLQKRSASNRTDPDSSVPYSVLSCKEMMSRMKNLHDQFCRMQKQHNQLKELVDAHIQANGTHTLKI